MDIKFFWGKSQIQIVGGENLFFFFKKKVNYKKPTPTIKSLAFLVFLLKKFLLFFPSNEKQKGPQTDSGKEINKLK